MAAPDIPADLLRLAEALVFASPEPATWKTLVPWLPPHLDAQAVFQALQDHCAGRGVILVEHAGCRSAFSVSVLPSGFQRDRTRAGDVS